MKFGGQTVIVFDMNHEKFHGNHIRNTVPNLAFIDTQGVAAYNRLHLHFAILSLSLYIIILLSSIYFS